MTRAMEGPTAGGRRYLVPVALAILVVAAVPTAVGGSREVRASAPEGLHPDGGGAGATQLTWARATMAAGLGPRVAVPDPAAIAPAYRWSNLTGKVAPSPSGRFTMMAWDGADGYVLLFGGITVVDQTGTFLGDTWTFLNGTWRNITATVTGSPPPVAEGSMAYDPAASSVILFGGVDVAGNPINATWGYHAGVWTNLTHLSPSAPSPRGVPGLAYDSTDGVLLLAGGIYQNDTATPGTWTFAGDRWTNITGTAPYDPRLSYLTLADDPADHGVLATGLDLLGAGYKNPFEEVTFLYAEGSWHNLSGTLAQEPPPLYTPALVYDPGAHGDFLISGLTVNATGYFGGTSVTWEYRAGAWVNLTASSGSNPVEGLGPAGAVDPVDDSLITFGRSIEPSENTTAETWVLATDPLLNASTPDPRIDTGGSVPFTGSIGGGIAPYTVRWDFGDGTNSTSLSPTHRYASAGLLEATLTVTDFGGQTSESSVAVVVASPPTVTILANTTHPVVGQEVELVALPANGTAPYLFAWSGASPGTGPQILYASATAGSFSIAVNVTDATGARATAEVTLVVGPRPSTAGSTSSTSGIPPVDLAGLLLLAVVAAIVGYLVGRRRGGSPSPPAPLPPYSGVPHGASGPPPPPPPPG